MASSSKYSVASKNNQGSNPASTYDKAGNTANKPLNNSYNIVKDYTWTLTPRRNINNLGEKDSINDVPYVYLTEYSVDESFIKAQAAAFSANAEDTTSGTVTGSFTTLQVISAGGAQFAGITATNTTVGNLTSQTFPQSFTLNGPILAFKVLAGSVIAYNS